MSTVKSFTAGSMTVNASMPSALEQDEALSLLGHEIVQRAVNSRLSGDQLNVNVLITMLASMPITVKRRVSDIMLSKSFVAGTSTRVTVADFQGKMVTYNKLLSELILWNYEDFFSYLNDALSDAVTEQEETPL